MGCQVKGTLIIEIGSVSNIHRVSQSNPSHWEQGPSPQVCTFFRQLRQPPALLVSVDTPGMLAVQAVDEKLKALASWKTYEMREHVFL